MSQVLGFLLVMLVGAFGVGPFLNSAIAQAQSPSQKTQIPAPYAAGTSYQGAMAPALVDPNYQQCQQDCHLQKANENISLQASYILKKVQYLSGDVDDAGALSVLGSFCRPEETASSGAILSCKTRYLEMNKFWFSKVRSALGQNEIRYNMYHCAFLSNDGKSCLKDVGSAPSVMSDQNPDQNKYAQIAYFSTYDQLRTQQPNPTELAQVQDGVFDEAVINRYKPNKDDFIVFRSIPKDPENPSLGTYDIPESGSKKYDWVAYNKALSAWQKFHANAVATVANRKDLQGDTAAGKQAFQSDDSSNNSLRRQLYNTGRGEYIDQVNGVVSQQTPFNSTTATQSFQGKQSSASKLALGSNQVTGTYTGDEAVNLSMPTSGASGQTTSNYVTYSPNSLSNLDSENTSGENFKRNNQQDDITNPFF